VLSCAGERLLKLNAFKRHIPIVLVSCIVSYLKYVFRYSLSLLIFTLRYRMQALGLILSLLRQGNSILKLPSGEEVVITSFRDLVKAVHRYVCVTRLYPKVDKFVK